MWIICLELYYESKKGFLLIGGCLESSDFDKDTCNPFYTKCVFIQNMPTVMLEMTPNEKMAQLIEWIPFCNSSAELVWPSEHRISPRNVNKVKIIKNGDNNT